MDNRIAYGLAKRYGIDTSNMSPREVWQALKKKGVNIRIIERVRQKKEERARSSRAKKFFHDDGAQSNYTPELKHLLGEEFKGYKGQDAVDKLMKEKRGHVKGAFHRDDIGDIDLFWGNDYLGLQHIIKRREEQGINIKEFIVDLEKTIEKGKLHKKNNKGNYEYLYNGKMAVIAPKYKDNNILYVLTSYKTRYK